MHYLFQKDKVTDRLLEKFHTSPELMTIEEKNTLNYFLAQVRNENKNYYNTLMDPNLYKYKIDFITSELRAKFGNKIKASGSKEFSIDTRLEKEVGKNVIYALPGGGYSSR